MPSNVRFVAVNFEEEALATAVSRAGVDPGAPAFFSMLGVSQ